MQDTIEGTMYLEIRGMFFLFLYGNILTGTKKGALKEDLLLEKGWNGGVEARRSWERWWMAELG